MRGDLAVFVAEEHLPGFMTDASGNQEVQLCQLIQIPNEQEYVVCAKEQFCQHLH